MITKETKQQLIQEFGKNQRDAGSTQVQIAILTNRIQYLTEHMKTHKKDLHSRRGLIRLVNKRRKLLDYLHKTDANNYFDLLKKLNLRK